MDSHCVFVGSNDRVIPLPEWAEDAQRITSASESDAKKDVMLGGHRSEQETPFESLRDSDECDRREYDGQAITLRPYAPPSFLTPLGALAKRRALERRGFPSLVNWRFVTLTVDPARWADGEEAYEAGKERLRDFIAALRKIYSIRRWCWKLEFQDNGRAHWHVLLDYKRPILADDLTRLWNRGRTDIRRVKCEEFDYVFKYVAKEVEELPEWILGRHRVRFFQTSMGFFDSPANGGGEVKNRPSPRPCGEDRTTETQNEIVPKSTLGERLQRWSRTVVSRSISARGSVQYELYRLEDGATWGTLLVAAAKHVLASGKAEAEMSVDSWKVECFANVLRWLPVRGWCGETVSVAA